WQYSEDLNSIYNALAIWRSSATYSQRISSLRAGGGSDVLFAFTPATVLDDSTVDYLYGNQGTDWFWSFLFDQDDRRGSEANKEGLPIADSGTSGSAATASTC